MQKIRIIGFFFENRPYGLSEVEKKFLQMVVLGYIFIFKRNSLHVFAKRGKYLSHKRMQYDYSTKMFTEMAKPIRISGVLIPSRGREFKNVTALISQTRHNHPNEGTKP